MKLVLGIGAVAVGILSSINLLGGWSVQSVPLKGNLTSAMLAPYGMKLHAPSSPPLISQSQIAREAKSSPDAHAASQIRYEYTDLTFPEGVFSRAALRADPALRHDVQTYGHPVNLPVWIVSLEGLTLYANIGPAVDHEENLVYDAHSGQLLMTFSFR
jgi:hypothetical protein